MGAVALLVFCKTLLGPLLQRLNLAGAVVDSLVKSAPMYAVIVGVLTVQFLSLDTTAGVPIVGEIPTRLPDLNIVIMEVEQLQNLLPSALLIAMVIFMESTSIGTAVAVSYTHLTLPTNREV